MLCNFGKKLYIMRKLNWYTDETAEIVSKMRQKLKIN